MTNAWSRLKALLRRPLFGTRASVRGARVDPSQFPEDEFPVHCPACHYLLRGLPDGRCPECGEPFERGYLLVQEYVHDPDAHPVSHARWRFIQRAAFTCVWIFVALVAALILFVVIGKMVSLPAWTTIVPDVLLIVTVSILGAAGALYITVSLIAALAWFFLKPTDYAAKRRRVRRAARRQIEPTS